MDTITLIVFFASSNMLSLAIKITHIVAILPHVSTVLCHC